MKAALLFTAWLCLTSALLAFYIAYQSQPFI